MYEDNMNRIKEQQRELQNEILRIEGSMRVLNNLLEMGIETIPVNKENKPNEVLDFKDVRA
jgi:hypothetical protein